jgi:hypothetical protein
MGQNTIQINLNKLDEMTKHWTNVATKLLRGRTIVQVRYVTNEEIQDTYFAKRGLQIVLDNGTILYPMQDDEGNDFGAVHYQLKDGTDLILPTL